MCPNFSPVVYTGARRSWFLLFFLFVFNGIISSGRRRTCPSRHLRLYRGSCSTLIVSLRKLRPSPPGSGSLLGWSAAGSPSLAALAPPPLRASLGHLPHNKACVASQHCLSCDRRAEYLDLRTHIYIYIFKIITSGFRALFCSLPSPPLPLMLFSQ